MNSERLSLSHWLDGRLHPFRSLTVRIILLLIGDFIGAIALNNFLIPAHILSGGITGLAQIMQHFTKIGIGTWYFLFNIPLFILGYRYLGRRFIVLTGVAIIGFSVFTDFIHIHFIAKGDPLLISLYGGVLSGISSGIIFRIGGSTGGTDIVSLVFNRKTGRSIGSLSFAMNVVVVALSATVFGVEAGMYTLVAMFVSARVMNSLMNYQQRKTALIVSSKAEEIADRIFHELGRGATFVNASGAYTKHELGMLICALTQLEIGELRLLATEIDPNVFITVLSTTEVIGRFRHPAT
ncbi:YitT family protein [Alicyclobacillus cycloheptanicus]|jgi:uncharacterized membrane-anchored protein YitT (DUF2179 family)|uniref:Uncharacterized membrane-anchored protein YitT (DUF2179 family) n=1 Tax=Alicyclobacillus cycloheptanicus TaxID=1457 RepID=A0ABT9XLG3_9BACL|nr:YitT family protein [Alicyclobacillus cycloheptanicus]MDQ0191152.1 uncharacterized membrane-anchored protein YitT (DUF2179 family) [Alicyclobacillus cycloheptanicus]WDM01892.1 YitT family protein [Alicyclobacillus cycloheptanicus]